ncbi:MAG: YmfL family putative regulatory protein [Pseudomonas sp.]|uniref:YmfL family putative regulatory protein n=1 Tax=Pseudomonas sp. TaxID=306 RepID=UPI00339423A4
MKPAILETRRQVISAVIAAYPGGRECAAARLGLQIKKFDNHVYENAGSRSLSDDQIRLLEQDAGTAHLPDYTAALYGGVFVPMANLEELDNQEMYSRSVTAAAKRGAVDLIIAEALADGEIDANEIAVILDAHRKHVAARHAEVSAVIALHSKPHQDAR